MQQIMFIEGMKPLEEVPFTNREGKADVLPKQEFVLSDGINTIVAETVGNYARAASQLKLREGDGFRCRWNSACKTARQRRAKPLSRRR